MSKFKAGDTAWIKVVLTEHGNDTYPLIAETFEGSDFGNYTDDGKFLHNDKSATLLTGDEVREMLGVNKPKDEMRYFYVHFCVKDRKGMIDHEGILLTSKGMFSRKNFYAWLETELNDTSSTQIISWQELTKEDYEAFRA